MIDALEIALAGPWSFAGCFALAALIVFGASATVAAASRFAPFRGIVQVESYRHSLDNHATSQTTQIQRAQTEMPLFCIDPEPRDAPP
jgi:hypothetical protein